ncbi:plasmid mobilization relaxosome protein MobC [Streptomyces sp. AA8]|uniref:Plasmid mobilization relaxosome protein MobC n=1 Tax=Streptomyces telluris TaxID=2720021 RepID=A0A9X2LN69_9ACTN|nr:plasmid mobilization relaxosome protein MobC [Streptomyces telluris]MCQ8774054.1 plasmid mobilization relaxosome protein MobC [Streptomyces telluris]NJP78005.1 plasmid mobilization relaxosome protein MobC [Streptomyces telluris]
MRKEHCSAPSPTTRPEIPAHPAPGGARYGVGPSKGRSNANTSAPGVAEDLGHQGVPEEEPPADEVTLRRIARRRTRENTQRKERVDVRYSVDEKTRIVTRADEMGITGAHLVGSVITAYLDGDLTLTMAGQRTRLDDHLDKLDALRTEVARIGTNVNQIAHRLNAGGAPHPLDTTVLAHTERTLDAVRAAIGDIAQVMNHAVSAKAA